MESTQDLNELGAALAKVQGALKPAVKSSNNPYFKSKYADLQSCWDSCRALLSANGLSVVQTFNESDGGDSVTVSTTLLHSSGQWISGDLTMKPAKADPQGIGSAITYARRYALAAIVGIVADEDDDGNAATHNEPKKGLNSAEKAGGAAKVDTLISKDSEAFLKLADPSLVDRVLNKFGQVAVGDLTEAQAQKGIAWIKAETAKAESAKKPEPKSENPF